MQAKPLRAPQAASSMPLFKIRTTPSQSKGRQVKTTTTTTTTTTNVILNLQVQTTTTTTVTADVVKQDDMQTLEYNKGGATPDKFNRT
jgi:hypothetical protein